MTDDDALQRLQTRGWVLFPALVDSTLLARLAPAIDAAVAHCAELQRRKGMSAEHIDAAHHIVALSDSFHEFLRQRYLLDIMSRYLRGKLILNSYGANAMQPTTAAYFQNFHRDVRLFIPGYPTMVTMIVAVDPFTADNGGTWLASGSHLVEERPSDEALRSLSEQLIAPAGSIALFDSCVWHAAGVNRTPQPRRAMTLTFTRPFFKAQADYPRLLGEAALAQCDEPTRELLGYYSRTPASLEEWYQPREQRFYRSDQI